MTFDVKGFDVAEYDRILDAGLSKGMGQRGNKSALKRQSVRYWGCRIPMIPAALLPPCDHSRSNLMMGLGHRPTPGQRVYMTSGWLNWDRLALSMMSSFPSAWQRKLFALCCPSCSAKCSQVTKPA
jgi:hypothetical protein